MAVDLINYSCVEKTKNVLPNRAIFSQTVCTKQSDFQNSLISK